MVRLTVITDPDTALGFRLAGIEATEVTGAGEAAERLLALLRAKGTGIVVYNEEYRSAIPEPYQTAMEQCLAPIFFAIPVARAGRITERREEYLARLLRRTIGYQLKIKR
ncbi:MAG: V-type ATP synthase subunit F [Nitrospirae bacterium]|nr:V-type ATP synthase subunit F [Nitrospirota bacterium]